MHGIYPSLSFNIEVFHDADIVIYQYREFVFDMRKFGKDLDPDSDASADSEPARSARWPGRRSLRRRLLCQ